MKVKIPRIFFCHIKHHFNVPLLIEGSLALEEMEEVVGILYNLDGSEKVTLELCYSRSESSFQQKMETAERAEILFNELDDDAGGEISEEDFIR